MNTENHIPPNKVLIVEDDPAMLFLFQQVIASNGFEVVSAVIGEEGYRLASETRPDAIIVDTSLPNMAGFALLKRLKADEKTANIPTLATTAH